MFYFVCVCLLSLLMHYLYSEIALWDTAIKILWYLICETIWKSRHHLGMMPPSNGNIFHVTDPSCVEFTGHRWISLTKAELSMFSLVCAWINSWVNNREACDFRRHRAYYDVIVMECDSLCMEFTCMIHSGLQSHTVLIIWSPATWYIPKKTEHCFLANYHYIKWRVKGWNPVIWLWMKSIWFSLGHDGGNRRAAELLEYIYHLW